ncbi:hypothetical protein XELAEV_18019513mg [Xenopus laevis]|uniref:Sperm-associated antigen 7 n=1 Tax=Xenopus laevis TaxID=8355 RepID=A0A974DH14_XENLA|nr:hypothetical protein XELAEV_18019513mg [Xenopus laevis]
MADLLGSILSSMERPPQVGDQESRRKAKEQAARMKKMQEHERRQKVEFRKRGDTVTQTEGESLPLQGDTVRQTEGESLPLQGDTVTQTEGESLPLQGDTEFAPSDEELEAYRRGEEWDPTKAEEKKRLKELTLREAQADALRAPATVRPATDYKDKYTHLIGKEAAKDAAHTLQANKAYGCVPVANKRDTRSIEEAMNEIRAKKRLKHEDGDAESVGS